MPKFQVSKFLVKHLLKCLKNLNVLGEPRQNFKLSIAELSICFENFVSKAYSFVVISKDL